MAADLTESEAQRYDRQIRVWGAEAQARIQNSRVLVCGISNLNVEVVKNIVLAGMNVTLQGSRSATFDDLSHNFLLSTEDVGKQIVDAVLPRVQELNSFASITAKTTPLESLPDAFFQNFGVILLTECSEAQAVRINTLCRLNSPQSVFFWSDMFGDEGIFYADFGDNFTYKEDKQADANKANGSASSAESKTEPKIKQITFPSLEVVLAKRWSEVTSRHFPLDKTFVKHRLLSAFRETHGRAATATDATTLSQLLATLQNTHNLPGTAFLGDTQIESLSRVSGSASVLACSVLGSYLSQEVVKAVSLTGEPAFNVFVFSAQNFEAKAIPMR